MTELTIIALAADYLSRFELAKRADEIEYYRVKDEHSHAKDYYQSPLWRLISDAHGDMPPDDHKYRFIVEALENIIDNAGADYIPMYPDTYTRELIDWLGSNFTRIAYFDDTLDEHIKIGTFVTFFSVAQEAQCREKDEVLSSVMDSLNAIIEEKQSC